LLGVVAGETSCAGTFTKMSVRLTIKTSKTGAKSKLMMFPKDGTMSQFMEMASESLGINAKRAFLAVGDHPEIEAPDNFSPDDTVIVTEGGDPSEDTGGKTEEMSIKLAVLGAGGVGKSALTLRYVRDFFVTDWDPTIEDAYRTTVEVDDVCCSLEVLDTAGQDDFSALRPQWMMGKDGYIFVFGLDRDGSQNDLAQYYELHTQLKEEGQPKAIMLVGNKKDLVDEEPSKRIMTEEEGKALAAKWEAEYIETSAKTGHNIDELFQTFIRQVRALREKDPDPSDAGSDDGVVSPPGDCCTIL